MRPRLVALILLPTAAAVLLSGLQLTTALSTANEYHRTSQVASLVGRLATLSHELAEERDLTAWYIADHRRPARLANVKRQRGAVDQAVTDVLAAAKAITNEHEASVQAETAQARRWLDSLPGLRRRVTDPGVLPRAALGMYSPMIASFLTLHDDLSRGSGDEHLVSDGLALGALSRAKEQIAKQRGILLIPGLERGFDFDDHAELLGAWKIQLGEEAAFRQSASAAEVKRFRELVSGPKVDRADAIRALIVSRVRENRPLGNFGVRTWFDSSTAIVNGMRTLEREISASVEKHSQELEDAERRSAMISGAAILVLLVLILLITAWVAGTLVRPLRKLRSEALEVADTRLPETVRVLRESTDLSPDVEVPSIGVASRDEIGEVARAFDEVHREAIRLAGDEAKLRNNVNAMFVNLSRRTQSLVERQIDLIDDLEQGEQDETRLGSLFKLDHLATRMRRNSENLLVLAGQEQSRRWSEPVPLSDVVRASLSEVENYERVSLRIEAGTLILGSAVNDIVHLIAELVENAIFFSPQDTKITVSSNSNETGAIILAVTDLGIGMSDEEIAEANRRLAEPPAVDLSVSRRMGLFVVGRLAMRHGIRVQLRRPEAGGLSAVVLLPVQVVAQSAMAMAGQGPSQTSFGSMSSSDMFGGLSKPDPFGAGLSQDPFGAGPGHDSFGAGPGQDPFGAGPGQDPFGTAGGRLPSRKPPASGTPASQPPAPTTADLWSTPMVSASAVEDLWSSPLTPTAPPSFPDPRSPFRDPHPSFPTSQPSSPGSEPPFPPSWLENPPLDPWAPQEPEVVENTQAMPAVETPVTESRPEEFLPIFSAVGSDWFRSSASVESAPEAGNTPEAMEQRLQEAHETRQASPQVERQPWSTPSDQGWAAAEAAKKPAEGGLTGSGLPRRVPKANLVPGSAPAAPTTPPPASAAPPLSAERVRSRLSSFQQGIRQGRAEMSERLNTAEGDNQ
ncbi:nitrate- and nitrite sensing domain-containing protein [Streptosporangium sp. NPDC000396]|uniref:sensor histidine kinase n=1 Tax=Streptosporangium sp. NPDC000396 TaxID=3366185 RepID=UPI003683587D